MAKTNTRRFHTLDEVRGLCVILMVFYHAFYTMGYVFRVSFAVTLFDFFRPAEPIFAGIFIFLCGLCCHLSHNNVRRGLWLAAAAGLLSAVLRAASFWRIIDGSQCIWFGILQLLAVCILLYALLSPALRHIPMWPGVVLCAALFFLCWHLPAEQGGWFGVNGWFRLAVPSASTDTPWLYPLGLCPVSPCGDYFPLLPWGFCFFAGAFVGKKHRNFPKWLRQSRFPLFARVGRYSLWIYLTHQPLIFLLCYGLDCLISR